MGRAWLFKFLNVQMLSNKMCTFYTLNIAEVFSVSQSSDELIIQVMVIARNKRPAERFLVLLRCGLLQKRCFLNQNVQPTSVSGFLEIP